MTKKAPNEDSTNLAYAYVLKRIRKHLGLKQGEIATRLDISRAGYNKYERARLWVPLSILKAVLFEYWHQVARNEGTVGSLTELVFELESEQNPLQPVDSGWDREMAREAKKMAQGNIHHSHKTEDQITEDDVQTYWQEFLDHWKTEKASGNYRILLKNTIDGPEFKGATALQRYRALEQIWGMVEDEVRDGE